MLVCWWWAWLTAKHEHEGWEGLGEWVQLCTIVHSEWVSEDSRPMKTAGPNGFGVVV